MRRINSATSHRPPHIHPDRSTLFLTGRTYAGLSWLYPESSKRYFYNKLEEILPKYGLVLDAHVICNNHYHLLFKVSKGSLVPKFVKHLHGASSRFIRQGIAQFIARHGSVTEYGQILTREVTPWDRRQARRLRRINSASTGDEVVANFNSRSPREIAHFSARKKRRMNSANTNKENVIAKFISRSEVANFNSRKDERRLKSASTNRGVIAHFNARSGRRINSAITDPQVLALLASKEPPIWYQYTDHVIRDEGDYFRHLNYTHQNPVKHGYVKDMGEYQFSSHHRYLKERGKRWLADCFTRYPIVDFMPKGIGE